jgi:hypothetical protein
MSVMLGVAVLSGCVNKADLDAWAGVPVAELDKHPFFLTVPVVRTMASDGTEIRNYVNGQNVASCSGGGAAFATSVIWQPTAASLAACRSFELATISSTSKTVAFSGT